MNVWWWNRDTCGSGKGTQQPSDNAKVEGGGGESKRKEFKYSNFKNSCPCKITEVKAEIQLVEEAAITCSYCQSNAHSGTVQPLHKGGLLCAGLLCAASAESRRLKTLAAQHHPKQMAFQGSRVFHSQSYMHMLGPHCLSADSGNYGNTKPLEPLRAETITCGQSPLTTTKPGVFWVFQVCEHYAAYVQLLHPEGNTKALKFAQDTFGRL